MGKKELLINEINEVPDPLSWKLFRHVLEKPIVL